MGMYTEVYFHAEVDEEAFRVFEEVREGVVGEGHPAYGDGRMEAIFAGSRGSYYFPGATSLNLKSDDISSPPELSVTLLANIKNYERQAERFFEWVRPHVRYGSGRRDFIGYSIYEEADEPTLYYKDPE